MRNITSFKPFLFSFALTAGLFCTGTMQAQDIAFTAATNEQADVFGVKVAQTAPVVADFDNNGFMDIFASGQTFEWLPTDQTDEQGETIWNWTWYDGLNLVLNNGDGTYTTKDRNSETGLPIAYGAPGHRTIDFNQDGYTDFIYLSVSRGWTGVSQNKLMLVKNNGDGTFTVMDDAAFASIQLDANNYRPNEGNSLNCLSIADYNKDGYPDLLIQYMGNGRHVTLLKNINGEHFEAQDITCFIPQTHGSLSFGDFDGDGWPDIVSVGYTDDNGNIMHFYRNTQDGNFELATTDLGEIGETQKWGFAEDATLFVLDYNQDGKPDILCIGGVGGDIKGEKPYAQNNKRAVVLLNQSADGKFAFEEMETNIYPSSGNGERFAALGDFNGDGYPDYISYGWNGDWHVAASSSKGMYDAYDINENLQGLTIGESFMGFGDLNNDEMIDVMCVNSNDRLIYSINTTTATDIQKPSIPTDVKAEYNADTKQIAVTWTGSQTPNGSKAFYNLYLKNEDTGKTFMIVPADAETGAQRAYTAFSEYINPTTYTFEGIEEGKYVIGVQAVTYSWQASAFVTDSIGFQQNGPSINLASAEPADRAEVETATTFTLTFDQAVTLNTGEDAPEVYLMGRFSAPILATASTIENSDTQILLTLAEEATTAGMYTLQIPEKLVLNANGDWNASTTLIYTLTGKAVETTGYEPTGITPKEGEVNSLKNFVIAFAEYSYAITNIESQDQAYLINNNDQSKVNATLTLGDENKPNEIKVELDQEVTEAGSYTLVIPAKMIQESSDLWGNSILDNAPELKFNFTIIDGSGIDSILTDTESVNVYNVNGILVKKNASQKDLKNLKKGIYIINGKKIILK